MSNEILIIIQDLKIKVFVLQCNFGRTFTFRMIPWNIVRSSDLKRLRIENGWSRVNIIVFMFTLTFTASDYVKLSSYIDYDFVNDRLPFQDYNDDYISNYFKKNIDLDVFLFITTRRNDFRAESFRILFRNIFLKFWYFIIVTCFFIKK